MTALASGFIESFLNLLEFSHNYNLFKECTVCLNRPILYWKKLIEEKYTENIRCFQDVYLYIHVSYDLH